MTQELAGLFAGLVSLAAALIYFLSILGVRVVWTRLRIESIPEHKRTRPKPVTWFIWTLVGGLLAYSYYASGARDTLWVAIVLALEYLGAAILSIRYGQKGWQTSDILCLSGAVLAGLLWVVSGSPETTYLATLVIDAAGAYPTLKKAWDDPASEDKLAWTMAAVASMINLAAVPWGDATFAIAVYPVYMCLMNGAIALPLFLKRQ